VAVVAAAALEAAGERKARGSRSGDALTGLPMQG
jgi:hypothetical protein